MGNYYSSSSIPTLRYTRFRLTATTVHSTTISSYVPRRDVRVPYGCVDEDCSVLHRDHRDRHCVFVNLLLGDSVIALSAGISQPFDCRRKHSTGDGSRRTRNWSEVGGEERVDGGV